MKLIQHLAPKFFSKPKLEGTYDMIWCKSDTYLFTEDVLKCFRKNSSKGDWLVIIVIEGIIFLLDRCWNTIFQGRWKMLFSYEKLVWGSVQFETFHPWGNTLVLYMYIAKLVCNFRDFMTSKFFFTVACRKLKRLDRMLVGMMVAYFLPKCSSRWETVFFKKSVISSQQWQGVAAHLRSLRLIPAWKKRHSKTQNETQIFILI